MTCEASIRRLAAIAIGGLLLVAGSPGCKRNQVPTVAKIWDEAPAVGDTEALASLAPPWPTPSRAVLDNGLITFWLHEADAPVTHVRVLLPIGDIEALQSASVVAILHAHIATTMGSRGRNRGMVVQADLAPDRVEIAVHGSAEDTARSLELLAGVLSARAPAAGLEAARTEVLARLQGAVTPDERASAALVEAMLGRPPGSQRAEHSTVHAIDRDDLLEAWTQLCDPRRAILVVHAGDEAAAHRQTLDTVSERWRGQGRGPVPPGALERLRVADDPPPATFRLLAQPGAPLTVVPGPESTPVLMLGRVLPTPTPQSRSLARLAQRLLQEEVDARLVVRGDISIFMLRVPLSSRDPDRSATEAIDTLVALGATRQPAQRLFQTAQLWLGARVVQASLDGEDWTSLWSEAIDLSSNNRDITAALARDAGGMLEPDPDALQAWLRRWLDPRGGEPGWHWVVAGASKAELRKLAHVATLDE